MSAFEEQGTQRRRAPTLMALDTRIQRSYKGKLVKQRIERNRLSGIKRKYFKMLKTETEDSPAKTATTAAAISKSDNSEEDGEGEEDISDSSEREVPSKRKIGKDFATGAKNLKRKPRANPFKDIMEEREQTRKQREEEQRSRGKEIERAKRQRDKHLHVRKEKRKKHNARTSRGQPVLSNQINDLLTKIKKSK
ncbi:hypothetical protein BX070DRAFT_225176 [Coemansia spiralis]|nr:hypothetical protein BX070DRAFT_225176 [Coemansia spiralis]